MKVCSAFFFLLLASAFGAAGAGNAGEDPPEGRVPLVIRAADPDGGELQFNWQQLEGPTVQIADPKARRFDKTAGKWISETYFIPTQPGKYVFEVAVKNEFGLESKKRFVQEILPPVPLPDAIPGPNQKKKVGEKVVLTGVDSKAYGNRVITRYEWSIRQAPEGFALPPEQLTARQIEFTPKNPGKYVFELKVFDGKFWSDPPASVEVEVSQRKPIEIDAPPSPEPIVLPPPIKNGTNNSVKTKAVGIVIDAEKQFKPGDKIVLDGSHSTVAEGDEPQFTWTQLDIDKSPHVKIFTPDTSKPFLPGKTDPLNYPVQSFNAPENGTYRFVLAIRSKDSTVTESDPVTVKVGTGIAADPPPQNGLTAILTASAQSVKANEEVTLDGSKSRSETPGAKLSYKWMQVPGKNFPTIRGGDDGPIVRAYGEREGEYGVILVINDGQKVARSDPAIFKVVGGDKPPIVDLDKTQTCNVGDTVNVEARVSDPQGYPVTVKWTCLEPASMNQGMAEIRALKRFRFTPKTPGTMLFQIEATNSKGLTTTATTQIGVKDAAQLKPTASINGPETAKVGDKVTLSGAKSFSPNRKELTFTWRDETPGGPKIKDPPQRNAKEWTFTVTEPGRIVVTLVVAEGTVESEPAKFAVDVAAAVPVAKGKPIAKIDGPRTVNLKAEVELSGEKSTAADNKGDLQYFWSQPADGGPEINFSAAQRRARVLRFVPPAAGKYVITLTVVDQNNERSDPDLFAFEVKAAAAATPPKAAAIVLNNAPIVANKEVRLSAKDSVSPTNSPLTYKWKQVGGPQELVLARDNTQEIVATPGKAGTYEFQVVVSDGEQQSAPASVSFKVEGGAQPKAEIAEIIPPAAGDIVVLDGTASKTLNGATGADALQFEWKQTKGESVRLPIGEEKKAKIQFTVPAEGQYTFELRVFDGNEWSEPASIIFTAKGRSKNVAPQAIVEKASITTEVGVETTIDASKSIDPDNGPEKLTFRWRRGEQVFNQSGPVLKFTPPAAGTLQFTVEAFDGKEYSQPAQVQINVLAPGALPVAKPKVIPNPAKKAQKPIPNNPPPNNQNKIIILDGTESLPARDKPDSKLAYTWKQTEGDNLTLAPAAMAKDRVGLYIYKPGLYKFQLVVSDNEHASLPVEVELKVEDE